MQDEKWQETVVKIKTNFTVSSHTTEDLPEDRGLGTVETVEFTGPLGKIKLERTTQPLILDRKSLGSKRIGSDKVIQYTYSDTEKVHKLIVYKWNDANQDWEELKMDRGDMVF